MLAQVLAPLCLNKGGPMALMQIFFQAWYYETTLKPVPGWVNCSNSSLSILVYFYAFFFSFSFVCLAPLPFPVVYLTNSKLMIESLVISDKCLISRIFISIQLFQLQAGRITSESGNNLIKNFQPFGLFRACLSP